MGERVQVGTLIYTVLDAEWRDQLGAQPKTRLPQHRFLAVQLMATNGGSAVCGVPMLSLVNESGKSYEELSDGEGLEDWLGYLRTLKPGETIQGRVLFDAPLGAYNLRLVNDADLEDQRSALVDIPLQLGPRALPQPVVVPPPQ
jgi:hypothetical protein